MKFFYRFVEDFRIFIDKRLKKIYYICGLIKQTVRYGGCYA